MKLREIVTDTIARLGKAHPSDPLKLSTLLRALSDVDEDEILGELSTLEDEGLIQVDNSPADDSVIRIVVDDA